MLNVKNLATAYVVNTLVNVSVIYAIRKPLTKWTHEYQTALLEHSTEPKEFVKKSSKVLLFQSSLLALNMATNKALTGHYIRVWKD